MGRREESAAKSMNITKQYSKVLRMFAKYNGMKVYDMLPVYPDLTNFSWQIVLTLRTYVLAEAYENSCISHLVEHQRNNVDAT